jgi:hypothetical protein
VPTEKQNRVLTWGIVGAMLMRAIMVSAQGGKACRGAWGALPEQLSCVPNVRFVRIECARHRIVHVPAAHRTLIFPVDTSPTLPPPLLQPSSLGPRGRGGA